MLVPPPPVVLVPLVTDALVSAVALAVSVRPPLVLPPTPLELVDRLPVAESLVADPVADAVIAATPVVAAPVLTLSEVVWAEVACEAFCAGSPQLPSPRVISGRAATGSFSRRMPRILLMLPCPSNETRAQRNGRHSALHYCAASGKRRARRSRFVPWEILSLKSG